MRPSGTIALHPPSPAWRATPGFSRGAAAKALADLRRPRPWAWLGAIAVTWSVIALAIVAAQESAWFLPLAWLVIASRQHALGVLMHDGAHGAIHANPRINLWLADAFAAWPLGITTAGFRRSHLAHHAHTHTARDPDLQRKIEQGREEWATPMRGGRLAQELACDLLGRGSWRWMRRVCWYGGSARHSRATRPFVGLARCYFAATLAVVLSATGTWSAFVVYWLVPLLFVLPPMLRMRSLAEHFALPHDDALSASRDVEGNWLEAQLFGPFGIRWHLAHHLFPDIPAVSIGRARRMLLGDATYRTHGTSARGYLFGPCSVRAALAAECRARDR